MASSETSNESANCQTMKKLSELKVIELRNELERRNLDKTGVKVTLIERLAKDLREKGSDPNDFLFRITSNDTLKKNVGKRTGTPVGKMSMKEREDERDSDISELDGQDTNDSEGVAASKNVSNEDKGGSTEKVSSEEMKRSAKPEKTGLEAADIVEDALQLDIDDELNEYRDDEVLDLTDPRKDSYKATEDQQAEEESKEKQETHKNGSAVHSQGPNPVAAATDAASEVPIAADGVSSMDTSSDRKSALDDESLVVHVDDTTSEIDGDLDTSCISSTSNHDAKKHSSAKKEKMEDEGSSTFQEKEKSSNEISQNEPEAAKEEKEGNEKGSSLSNNSSAKDSSKEAEKASSKTKSSTSKSSKSSSSDKKNASSTSIASRNVWVSGLSPNTRASDLQALFKKFGKVVSAKIITNTRIPGSRCYGFITMETAEQAEKCIQNLNKTELHGRTITVEKNRQGEASSSSRSKSSTKKEKEKEKEKSKEKTSEKVKEESSHAPEEKEREKETKEEKTDKVKTDDEKEKKEDSEGRKSKAKESKDGGERKSSERSKRSPSPIRKPLRRNLVIRKFPTRRPAPSFITMRRNMRGFPPGGRPNPVLLRRIETERVIRRRERERELRETERRRMELMRHQREIERKQQEERDRLEREKEKLRQERERLEREKADLIRLEREKARLERERIEREREELRRRPVAIQHRLEESSRSRATAGVAPKRPYESRDPRDFDPYWEERKRPTARIDAPAAPSGRPSFPDSTTTTSRFSDFDARNSHTAPYDRRGESYKGSKLDIPSTATSRTDYEIRRDSARHGGHDRDDRRGSGGGGASSGGGQSGYYRESSRSGAPGSRDRDRRSGGSGREDWKTMHESRRDRYLDKTLSSGMASYGSNTRSFVGGDRGSSVGDSRSRGQPNLSTSIISGGSNPIGGIFGSNANIPMAGIMSHANINTSSGINSSERSYIHSVRRF